MKIKASRSDFQVFELPIATDSPPGHYSLYRLRKEGWTTPDALGVIGREWKISTDRISFAGLKDKHAQTSQYISIWEGPTRNFDGDRLSLEYIGPRLTPFTSADTAGNRFQIAVRNLDSAVLDRVSDHLRQIAAVGVPNYFDDQRFGSVGAQGRFIARAMIDGHFEEALKLALVAPYEHDRAGAKAEKELLRQHWGDWRKLKATLPRGAARNLMGWLAFRPGDYRGAVERLRPELQGLYLAAYQSHVWNRTLARWLAAHCRDACELPLKLGAVPAPTALEGDALEEWRNLEIPLPSARLKPAGTEMWFPALQAVLAEEGLPLDKMKVGVRRPFFSKGSRRACVFPENLKHEFLDDDRHPGRQLLSIAFDLPPGSYATIVLKRLLQTASLDVPPSDDD